MNDFPFIRDICELLQGKDEEEFAFGSLTLVDFYFWETCFYILGIFDGIEKEDGRNYESFYRTIVPCSVHKKSNKLFLNDMRKFVAKMKKMPHYIRCRDYL